MYGDLRVLEQEMHYPSRFRFLLPGKRPNLAVLSQKDGNSDAD